MRSSVQPTDNATCAPVPAAKAGRNRRPVDKRRVGPEGLRRAGGAPLTIAGLSAAAPAVGESADSDRRTGFGAEPRARSSAAAGSNSSTWKSAAHIPGRRRELLRQDLRRARFRPDRR